MDNLTHSLVGALMGQTGLKKKTGLAMPALIIGANLPDVDAACFFWLDGTEHLGFRRGITHGPPAMVLLPLILAGLLWAWDRWQISQGKRPDERLPVHFGWLYALSLIGCLSHPALDWMNVYGIRLLEPFSSQWFYGDTLFIIDVWLWALLGLGLWFSLRREKRGGDWRKAANTVLAIGAFYIFLNWINSQLLILHEPSVSEAILSPVPLASWQREVIVDNQDGTYVIDGNRVGDDRLWQNCDLNAARGTSSQIDAFLFWSRAPVLERQAEGEGEGEGGGEGEAEAEAEGAVILGDARFYDPRARGRFSIEIPAEFCVEPEGQASR